MKWGLLILLFIISSPALAQEWSVEKSDHFLVHHQDDSALAQEVKKESERYYRRIAEEIGFRRYSNFWTWDNRCKIFIYPTKASFIDATGQPQWSAGCADYAKRSISTYRDSEDFLKSLLPHEMTHLIFRDFVGFKGEIPLWLDEGLAQFMEIEKREANRATVKKIVEEGRHIPIPTLTRMDVRGSDNTALVALFYAQASLLVGYLIEDFGADRFTDFCRQLRDGKSIDEALRFAYPGNFRSVEDLDQSWVEYVKTF